MGETRREIDRPWAFNKPVRCESTLTVVGATTVTGALVASAGVTGLKAVNTFAATGNITAAMSGSYIIITGATGYALNLPALAAGLYYDVLLGTSPTSGNHTIVTASAANVLIGRVHSSTGGNADAETSGGDTITFAANTALKGDTARLFCDGTNWYATIFCDADAGVTIDTAA